MYDDYDEEMVPVVDFPLNTLRLMCAILVSSIAPPPLLDIFIKLMAMSMLL